MQTSCNKPELLTLSPREPTVKMPPLVFVAIVLQLFANKKGSGRGRRTAVGAIASYFEPRHDNMKAAITLDLALETVEQVAFKFHDLAAAQAGHVDVVALGPSLVEMLFPFQMHEVQFIDQAVALEEAEGAIHSHAIDLRIDATRLAQDLAG